MNLNLLKCHGSNNDFILIDEVAGINPPIPESARSPITKTLCDRETGIGADGVLFYLPSDTADCQMRMFNPDGSEAEMCGNGLRCVGRYCTERLARTKVLVETKRSVLCVEKGAQIYEGIETFEAEIGPVSLEPSSLPMVADGTSFQNKALPELQRPFPFTALTVPNPHIVTVVHHIDREMVQQCGVIANNSRTFPRGVNVSFVRDLGNNSIFVVTYERGVGITNSCGTAMSASSYVASLNGITRFGAPIHVFNVGGMVVCEISDKDSNIILKGNATFVFEAMVTLSEDAVSIVRQHRGEIRADEVSAYASLQEYASSMIGAVTD